MYSLGRLTNRLKYKTGFTLVELLVVISIIGMLSSVVLASLSTARESAEDAKLLLQLRDLNTAVNAYKIDKGHYPSAQNDPYGPTPSPNYDPRDHKGVKLLQQLKTRGYTTSEDVTPYRIFIYTHTCDAYNQCFTPEAYLNDVKSCGVSPLAVAGIIFTTRRPITQYPQWFSFPNYYIMCLF